LPGVLKERDSNVKKTTLTALKISSAPLALGLAFFSSAAFAQAAGVDCAANATDPACAEGDAPIIVTGYYENPVFSEDIRPADEAVLKQVGQLVAQWAA